jgi:hypothetical protein
MKHTHIAAMLEMGGFNEYPTGTISLSKLNIRLLDSGRAIPEGLLSIWHRHSAFGGQFIKLRIESLRASEYKVSPNIHCTASSTNFHYYAVRRILPPPQLLVMGV